MPNQPPWRCIRCNVLVRATVAEVWDAWTTEEGIESFFAPQSKVGLRVGGPCEIFFNPNAPSGERGGEGMRILAIQPPKMLAFTWTASPHLPRFEGSSRTCRSG